MSIFGMSLSRPGTRRPPSERRQEILDQFEELIRHDGFRHLTVGSIAEALHCSRRTLYELAPSKDDLVELAVTRLLERTIRAVREEVARAHTASEGLLAAARRATDEARSWSSQFGTDLLTTTRCVELVQGYNASVTDIIRDQIERGIATGEFAPGMDAELAARASAGALSSMQQIDLIPRGSISFEAAIRHTAVILLAGLRHAEFGNGVADGGPARPT